MDKKEIYINGVCYKHINGYDKYFINADGEIISFKSGNNGKRLSSVIDKSGYVRVCLMKSHKLTHILLHRLVAETFMLDKNNFKSMPNENRTTIDMKTLEINHKDENKLNNNIDNLEWCTHRYNSNYGNRVYKIIPKVIDKTRTPVSQYDDNGMLIKEWYSTNEAARTLNICQQNITKCCQGLRKHAGGYVWKYHCNGGDV